MALILLITLIPFQATLLPVVQASTPTGVFFKIDGQDLGSANSQDVALDDLDGDGDLDAFVANYGQNKIWLNNGDGTFTDGVTLGNATSTDIALGDFDSVNGPDAFVTNYGEASKVWLNNGDATFSPGQDLDSSNSTAVVLAQLDGIDGIDAFVANNGANKVWLGNGDGTFDSGQELPVSVWSFGVALGDVDGSNGIDAVIANDAGETNIVWQNNGSGNFSDNGLNLGSSGLLDVALGDVDGANGIDAVTANFGANMLWTNDGTGTFTLDQNLDSANSNAVALGDVNDDGSLDIFFANNGVNTIWMNDGSGSFTESEQTELSLSSTNSNGVALGDLDGDGDVDAFVANNGQNTVWRNMNEPPDMTIGDATAVTEGDSGTVNAIFTVTLADKHDREITVDYEVLSGMATVDTDVVAQDDTLTFAIGDVSKQITVEVNGDTINEADETFTVKLSNATNANITDDEGEGEGTITDDDPITLSISDAGDVAESAGNATFTVQKTGGDATSTEQTIKLNVTKTLGDTEAGDTDNPTPNLLTIPANLTDATIDVFLTDDTINEADESFSVSIALSGTPNGVTIDTDTANGTITDDDPITLSISNAGNVAESAGNATFTVSAAGATSTEQTITLDVSKNAGDTEAGDTDNPTSDLLTIPANLTDATIDVSLTDDTINEADESFSVGIALSGTPNGVTIDTDTANGTITDDDPITLSISNAGNVAESAGNATFTVSAAGATSTEQTITLDVSKNAGDTEAGDTDNPTSDLLTIPANLTDATIDVSLTDDTINEADESFSVGIALSGTPNGVTIDTDTANGTITDDDPITLSISNAGNVAESAGNATFTVSAAGATSTEQTITLDVSKNAGDTEAGDTDNPTSDLLTIPANLTDATIDVSLTDDTINEANESFSVGIALSGTPNGVTIDTNTANGTITDDDTVTFSIADVEVNEVDEEALFTVKPNGATATEQTITMDVSTANGSANGNATKTEDYGEPDPNSLIFTGTLANQDISVPIVADEELEDDETFTVNLDLNGTPNGVIVPDPFQATGTIHDAGSLTFSINDVVVDESASEAELTITPSGSSATQQIITVNVATMDDIATHPNDYGDLSTTSLTFDTNTLAPQTVTVPIEEDTINEANETFTVTISLDGTYDRVGITKGEGVVTINDNDSVIFSIAEQSVNEGDGQSDFAILAEGADSTEQTITLNAHVTHDSTEADDIGSIQSLIIEDTFTNLFLPVPVTQDTINEVDERFEVHITLNGAPTGVTVAADANTATGTIIDDDPITFSFDDIVSVVETEEQAIFTVRTVDTLASTTEQSFTLDVSTSDASATSPSDYGNPTPNVLRFGPQDGSLSLTDEHTIIIPIVDDGQEDVVVPETYTVTLTLTGEPQRVAFDNELLSISATGEIYNPGVVIFSLRDKPDIKEEDGQAIFLVEAKGSSDTPQQFTLNITTDDGTSTNPADYGDPLISTLSIDSADLTGPVKTYPITIPIAPDKINETDETFTVTVSLDTVYDKVSLPKPTGIGTIVDNDAVSFAVGDIVVAETVGAAVFPVTPSGADTTEQRIAFNVNTQPITATIDDYGKPSPNPLIFGPGVLATQYITVPLTQDNNQDEPDETFTLQLVPVRAFKGVSFTKDTGTCTITDTTTPEPTNAPPTAQPDSITVAQGKTVSGNVLANDSDPDGDAIHVETTPVSGPTHGTLTLNDDGTFTYIHDESDTTEDSFTYQVCDNAAPSLCDQATVSITIVPLGAPKVGFTQSSYRVPEDEGIFPVPVTLSHAFNQTVTVQCVTEDMTALVSHDYKAPNNPTLTFAPGETRKNCDIPIVNDNVDELQEQFSVRLTDPENVLLGEQKEALLTISGVPGPPIVKPTTSYVEVCETEETVTVSVTLNVALNEDVKVAYKTFNGTAVAGEDYKATEDTLTFPAHRTTTHPVVIPILPDHPSLDGKYEPDKDFFLSLEDVSGHDVVQKIDQARITILDAPCDIPRIQFVSDSYAVQEDAGTAIIDVTLDNTSQHTVPVTIFYDTGESTANAGSDFEPLSDKLLFPPSKDLADGVKPNQTFTITLVDDTDFEGDETVKLGLRGITTDGKGAARIGKPIEATLTITDNDNLPGKSVIYFSDIHYLGFEPERGQSGKALITVLRSGEPDALASTATVTYTTNDGTAHAGSDYDSVSRQITFAPDETEQTFVVPLRSDSLPEGNETVLLHLKNPSDNAIVGTQRDAVLTIQDGTSDITSGIIQFSASEYSMNERSDAEGVSNNTATITVLRTNGSEDTVTVDVETFDDTATAGSDYSSVRKTLTFPPGWVEQTFDIPIINDERAEGPEKVSLRLSNVDGGDAVLGSQYEADLIITDDETGTIQFENNTYRAKETDGSTSITVYRNTTEGTASAAISIFDQTAYKDIDYTYDAKDLIIEFAEGETSHTFPIAIIDNQIAEGDKDLLLILSNAEGIELGSQRQATLTIEDDPSDSNGDAAKGGTVQFERTEYPYYENRGCVPIRVQRQNIAPAFAGEVIVRYATYSDDEEHIIPDVDYAVSTDIITFTGLDEYQSFEVCILDDEKSEGEERVELKLEEVTGGATLGRRNTAELIIIDDEPPPPGGYLSFAEKVFRAKESDNQAVVYIKRTGSFMGTVSVQCSAHTGSAKGSKPNDDDDAAMEGKDFVPTTQILTFAPNVEQQPCIITLMDDDIIEGTEHFNVKLDKVKVSNDTTENFQIGTPYKATVEIEDDEPVAEGVFVFSASGYEVHEDHKNASITVKRESGRRGRATVQYATKDGTARAKHGDYTPKRKTLVFENDEVEKTFSIDMHDDQDAETDEFLWLELSSPSNGAELGTEHKAKLTIIDNDLPVIRFGNMSFTIKEHDGVAFIIIMLNKPSKKVVTVIFTADYTTKAKHTNNRIANLQNTPSVANTHLFSETVTFGTDDTQATIKQLPINDDMKQDRRIELELSDARNAILRDEDSNATLVVQDDDNPTLLTIEPSVASIVADGKETVDITARVLNQFNDFIQEQPVTFSITPDIGIVSPVTATTDDQGIATTNLTGNLGGTVTMTATAEDATATTLMKLEWPYNVYLPMLSKTDPPYGVFVDMTPSPAAVQASSTKPISIAAHILMPDLVSTIRNETVTFTITTTLGTLANGKSTMVVTDATTDAGGNLYFTLIPSSTPGTATVTVSVHSELVVGTGTIKVPFAALPTSIAVTATNTHLPLAGTTTIEATLKDNNDNPVPDEPVTFSASAESIHPTKLDTNDTGKANTTLHCPASLTAPSIITVTATVGSHSAQVPVLCGTPASIDITSTPASMDARLDETATIAAIVKDADGAIIPGQLVTFTTNNGTLDKATGVTNGKGEITAELSNPDLVVGTFTVTLRAGDVTEQVGVEVEPVAFDDTSSIGDTPANAAPIPFNTAYMVAGNDTLDAMEDHYYQFELGEPMTVTIALQRVPQGADYNLELWRASNMDKPLDKTFTVGDAIEPMTMPLEAGGTYYLRVHKKEQVSAPARNSYVLGIVAATTE